jgi:uncharacterized protein (DUF983 family)
MYCSSCGGSIVQAQGLTFCNHCGSRLALAKRDDVMKPRDINPESLVWAIVAIFVGGLAIIIGLAAVLQNVLHLNLGLISFFLLVSFSLMTIIEATFIWRFIAGSRSRVDNESPELAATAKPELGSVPAKALAEPLHSVTDQTTRSFEPIYTNRSEQS